jgi:hypothetical protein
VNRYAGKSVAKAVLTPLLAGIRVRYGLTGLDAVRAGDRWAVAGKVNPEKQEPSDAKAGPAGSFSLAPGGLAVHEGHTILTAAKPKTIHLLSRHGETVTDVDLQKRLKDFIALFRQVRADKITIQSDTIAALQTQIADLLRNPQTQRRDEKIAKIQDRIDGARLLVGQYQAIDDKNRDQVFEYLDKWKKGLPNMVSKEVTRFTDNKVMEATVKAAIAANQARIDAALVLPDGTPRSNGDQTSIRHPAPPGLAAGYELDANNEPVPITRALTTVELRLVVSDSANRYFMVETGYFS